MSTPTRIHDRLCVIVVPSMDAGHWRAVVRQTAEEQGLRVYELDAGETPDDGVDALLLANDPRIAEPFGPTQWAVIWSRPSTGGGADAASLIHAAGVMASLSLLPRGTEMLTDRDLMGSVGSNMLFGRLEITHKHTPLTMWDATSHTAALALALYDEGPPRVGSRCEWVPDVFFYDEKASSTIGHMGGLPISGTSRALVFGPFLALPPGRWKVTATFSVDELASFRNYRAEWGSPSGLTTANFSPGRPGIYRLEIENTWTLADAAELRITLAEGALSGELRFQGAIVEMVGD